MRSKLPLRAARMNRSDRGGEDRYLIKKEPLLVALFIAQKKNVFGQMEERFSEYDLVFKGYG
jgi:hypothetical protein